MLLGCTTLGMGMCNIEIAYNNSDVHVELQNREVSFEISKSIFSG